MNLYKILFYFLIIHLIFLFSCKQEIEEHAIRKVYLYIDGELVKVNANFDTIKPISDKFIIDTSYQHNNSLLNEYIIKKNI